MDDDFMHPASAYVYCTTLSTESKVEYATSASFLGEVKSVAVTYLDGGSPFYKTVSGLDKGQRYYVRVSACNGQGCGTPQGSAPSSAAPYEESGAPSNVVRPHECTPALPPHSGEAWRIG